MFERFTNGARDVVVLAQGEAIALKHPHIGTEHLLPGLLREGKGLGATALAALGVTIDAVRSEIVARIGEGKRVVGGQVPFTPSAKEVIGLSLREALVHGHQEIGTEHILLGLVRLNEGVATNVLNALDADAATVRDVVLRLASRPGSARSAARSEPSTMSARSRVSMSAEPREPRPLPLPPLSETLRQALTTAVETVGAAKTTAKRENDTRRMAIILHAERLLESVAEPTPHDAPAE